MQGFNFSSYYPPSWSLLSSNGRQGMYLSIMSGRTCEQIWWISIHTSGKVLPGNLKAPSTSNVPGWWDSRSPREALRTIINKGYTNVTLAVPSFRKFRGRSWNLRVSELESSIWQGCNWDPQRENLLRVTQCFGPKRAWIPASWFAQDREVSYSLRLSMLKPGQSWANQDSWSPDSKGMHPRPVLLSKSALSLNFPNPSIPNISFPGSLQGSEPTGAD